jgi:hypothetical protein
MGTTAMTLDFRRSVVRIDIGGEPKGTGFVAGAGLVVTCAHVVAGADRQPSDQIRIVFHHGGEQREASVSSAFWRDPDGEDIAFLTYEGELPPAVVPVGWALYTGAPGDPCVTFGYPDVDLVNGLWGHGVVSGPVEEIGGRRLLQIRSPEVTGGFSGAPLFNQHTRLVIGMVSETTLPDDRGRLQETVFITPSDVLLSICPAVRREAATSAGVMTPGARHRQQIRLEGTLKQWDTAYDKLSRLERSFTLETRVDERMRLEQEVAEARQRLQGIEKELEVLESSS